MILSWWSHPLVIGGAAAPPTSGDGITDIIVDVHGEDITPSTSGDGITGFIVDVHGAAPPTTGDGISLHGAAPPTSVVKNFACFRPVFSPKVE